MVSLPWSKGKRSVPKQFRQPRTSAIAAPSAVAQLVGTRAYHAALAGSFLFCVLLPTGPVDSLLHEFSLGLVKASAPPIGVVAVTVDLKSLQNIGCERSLSGLHTLASVKAIVITDPLRETCSIEPVHKAPQSRDQAHKLIGLSKENFTLGPMGNVHGLTKITPRIEDLDIHGLRNSSWVRSFSEQSVPTVRLDDLLAGRVSETAWRNRTLVFGINSPELGATRPTEIAAVLGGIDENYDRLPTPLIAWLLVLGIGTALVGWVHSRLSPGRTVLVSLFLVGLICLFQVIGLSLFAYSLFPISKLVLGVALTTGALILVDESARRKALARAMTLTERVSRLQIRSQELSDADFFTRVGDLALLSHPADFVLVAEVPPRQWHMKFWSHRGAGESLVKEVRRDFRRTPYSNEHGSPTIRVVENFLVMRDIPVLVVPLQALGEIEGYVFLCGTKARDAFAQDKSSAEQLAIDLGLMLRARRVSLARRDVLLDAQGAHRILAYSEAGRLAAAAEAAFLGSEQLNQILREMPSPVLYADEFADVRVLSKPMVDWLQSAGIALPDAGHEAPLNKGVLDLRTTLIALTRENEDGASRLISRAMAQGEVTSVSSKDQDTRSLTLRVMRRLEDGLGSVQGFVLALSSQDSSDSQAAPISRYTVSPRGQLVAFPVADVIKRVVAEATRESGTPIRLSTLPVTFALGARTILRSALTTFLADMAAKGPSGQYPTIAVVEKEHHVEISILNLYFGLPQRAVQQFVDAPDCAPADVQSLAILVDVVADSQGELRLRDESGWGLSLVISLLRARVDAKTPPPPSSMRPMYVAQESKPN